MTLDSLLLAQIIGPFCVIMGFAMLINCKRLIKMTDTLDANNIFIMFGGAFNLLLGLFLVIGHNVWVKDWPVIITIFAWMGVVKGVCLLLFPESSIKTTKCWASQSFYMLSALVFLAIGAYLSYVSFYV